MPQLRVIFGAVFAISFLTFVAFFGQLPGLRRTPIGFLHRCLWVYIPRFFRSLDQRLTGGRLSNGTHKLGNKLFYDKHPLVTIFFLGLITISASISVPANWPFLPTYHRLGVLLAIAGPYVFTYLCYISKPGSPHLISAETYEKHLTYYPYDHAIFHPNNMCSTCQRPKPPRSKHCSLCKTCVARCDHHCIWINNCVGRGNHKYFLYLLFSTFLLLAYSTYIHRLTLVPQIREHYMLYPEYHVEGGWQGDSIIDKFFNLFDGWLDYFGTAVLIGGLARGGVAFLSVMCVPLPLGLLSYHIYLIWAGMTTNESSKWSDMKADMDDGEVYRAKFLDGYIDEGLSNGNGHMEAEHYSAPRSRWPHRSRYIVVRTNDGQPPRKLPENLKMKVGDNEWEQVWSLKDVENIYDLGFWGNLREILWN